MLGQKTFNKVVDKIGMSVFITLAITLVIVSGMLFAKNAIASYLTDNFTKPFLAPTAIATHNHRAMTTPKLHIEYTVLKVNNQPVKK